MEENRQPKATLDVIPPPTAQKRRGPHKQTIQKNQPAYINPMLMAEAEGHDQDPAKMSHAQFMLLISNAQMEGTESIEAPEHIFKHYNRHGLGGAKFFIFQGIKVYPLGQTKAIETEINTPIAERIHGKTEAKVDNADQR